MKHIKVLYEFKNGSAKVELSKLDFESFTYAIYSIIKSTDADIKTVFEAIKSIERVGMEDLVEIKKYPFELGEF